MAINIFLLNSQEEKIQFLDYLDMYETINISTEAAKENLKCLSGLDYIGYTIYNQEQIHHVKKELDELSNSKQLYESVKKINSALNKISSSNISYLMFEGE